ncbi:MAG: sulfurtransferase [Trueperaceae bacterium]|jgi:thiosulfate/3-mercaptopyruvate sulfurtransferase|nr:sulfurtransferase [Trueperaceae bacterium]MCC6311408.1 sulfurtransferase [Trueperaceae bacterium]MCO5174103.1 sulfurtransferase [Trueperaceae bacterium]MCW5820288.1 sulfurtransferase [Trueperaceae bacterium]
MSNDPQGYAHPEVLVDTAWLDAHKSDAGLRVFEVDEDVLLYEEGHVPGALKLDWLTELQRPDVRDFIGPEGFATLMEAKGVSNDTTVVLYGDKSNWWAAYAFWFFKYNGHQDVRLMNGGRQKWVEEGRTLTSEVPAVPAGRYRVAYRDASIRAFAPDVIKHLLVVADGKGALVDVRSEAEYTGEKLHMPDYPQEGALRGGHIPGAVNVPWARAANQDGTFKSPSELRSVYDGAGVAAGEPIVAYCRIAERSSHTWFVLKYLLGYPDVRNYDGSWTEWGNMVGVPINRGREP